MSDIRIKLSATIEAKRIIRLNINVAYAKLETLEERIKEMKNGNGKKKTQFIIDILKEELEKIEDNSINMIHGGNIEGGSRGGGGGGSGCDAG